MTESIVAICGWIIPTPLAMPLTVTGPRTPSSAGQVHGRRRGLGHRIGRAQGYGGGLQPVVVRRAAAGRGPSRPVATRSSGSRVPMIPVERWSVRSTVGAGRLGEQPGDLELVGVARRTGGGVRAATRRDDRLGPAEPAPRRRRTWPRGGRATGGPARPRTCSGVNTAAAAAGPSVVTINGEVRSPGGLDPGRQPTGLEAGRQGGMSLDRWEVRRGRRDGNVRDGGHGTSGSCSRPGRLGQAVDEVERLDRLAGRALDQVVLDADGEDPVGPLVVRDVDQDLVAAGDVLGGRGRRHDGHERLVGVRRRVQRRRARPGSPVASGRTWQADRMPRVIGIRCGRKSTAMIPGLAPGSRPVAGGDRRRAPARSRRRGGGRRCRTP